MASIRAILFVLLLALPSAAAAQTAGSTGAAGSPGAAESTAGSATGAVVTPPVSSPDHEALAPQAQAVPVEGEIQVDGVLDEPTWRNAPAITDFHQADPDNGEPATQRTEIRFAYDDEHFYIGARMYDDDPSSITARLARRDNLPDGDSLELIFDTFLDHLGRTIFDINPAGVRGESYGPGGSNPDSSWDPIYQVKTTIDEQGWTAEWAIPFSQLRFQRGATQTWGMQIWRTVNRLNEVQMWSFWGRNDQGGPPRFGHLSGIVAPSSRGDRLELLPYVTAQAETQSNVDPDDPFAEETDGTFRFGADLKYLVTSDLTLSATVNPDFGQAEVDPAVVNLSAFETFFPEKREFFIEGRGLFQYGGLWCFTCSNISSLDLLFTRRIGRSPQAAGLAFAGGPFADIPDASTILGAAKLTGRTRSGMSVGILTALTDREHARVARVDATQFDQEVEPLTSYAAARVRQDLMGGALTIGGMGTSVIRSFDDDALEARLPSHAEAVGADAEYWWGNRTYHLLANAAMSNVSGTEAAILRLQRASARFFQRPDRENGSNGFFSDGFDPTATNLRGYGTYTRVAKDAGDWRWEGSFASRSPGFEINDLGFLTRTDFLWLHGNIRQQWSEPTNWYRWLSYTAGGQRRWNYDGDMTESQLHGSVFYQAPFYWETSLFGLWRPRAIDDRATRGGPAVESPSYYFLSYYAATDRRKSVVGEVNATTVGSEEGTRDWSLGLTLWLQPASNVRLSVGPSIDHSESTAQFVTSVEDATASAFFGRRYVFSDLDQTSFSMETRLNWTFSPTMSLELFAQPLVSSNDFSRFKEFAAPRELDKVVYGEDVGTIRSETVQRGSDQVLVHTVDPDGPGAADEFSFDDPDFNFRSLRGNLVFRWEYRPGSTLFLVWTQDRSSEEAIGNFDLGRDVGDLFDADANHVFLIKATYWLGI
jgi:uncharacterized protein DUF5916